jgi:hypothetical protein
MQAMPNTLIQNKDLITAKTGYTGDVYILGNVLTCFVLSDNHFGYTAEVHTIQEQTEYEFIPENRLTKMSMAIAESSLKEDWDNEDDAHWESFLKD